MPASATIKYKNFNDDKRFGKNKEKSTTVNMNANIDENKKETKKANLVEEKTNLIEQVTCKHCGNVIYREVEQYKIYSEPVKDDVKNLYAVFVKKFICPRCNSTESTSVLVEKTNQNIINIDLSKKKNKKAKITDKIDAIYNDVV